MDQVLTEQEIVRRNKMEELRNKGIDPFGSRYERTATSGEIRSKYGEYTKEQLDNIVIFMGEAEDGIDVLPIKDYLTIEITNKILELLNEVRKNGREI